MNLMTRGKSPNVKYRIPEHVEWSLINTMISVICKKKVVGSATTGMMLHTCNIHSSDDAHL